MDPALFSLILTGMFLTGFIVPVFWPKRAPAVYTSLALALLGSLFGLITFGGFWLGAASPQKAIIWSSGWPVALLSSNLPPLQWEIYIDNLAAFFGFLITAFSALVAIYSFSALQAPHYRGQRHWIASAFNLFIWSTLVVVIANDVFLLLIGLEIMTLAFAYLALFKHFLSLEKPGHLTEEGRRNARLAPQVYLIISHTSTAFILIALLLLAVYAGGRLSFDDLRRAADQLNPAVASLAFLLALAGLGIRAGLTPAHFWVPLVHPSSPTTTHALSLGIAIKVAIYLMLRFFFEFLEPQMWWGYLVLLVAVITAFVNVWYAIASHDLKTALAYHSIENIGIITVGIGLALIFTSFKEATLRWIAVLALVASLYHLLNHAVFKGLLYLATGAIDNLTHQVVEFHKLGGLIKRYPHTSAFFLVGAISIAGFPPFNGFVSEWLTLQALLKGAGEVKNELRVLIILTSLILLAASFALTVFCFYKITGLTLLGEPRSSPEEWETGEAPAPMRLVMAIMALLCLGLGLFPGQVAPRLLPMIRGLGFEEVVLARPSWVNLQFETPRGIHLASPAIALMLVLVLLLFLVPILINRAGETRRPAAPWNCGTPYTPLAMQYTGAASSELIRRLLNYLSPRLAENAPDYLPARLWLSASQVHPQVVIELFRAGYNRGVDLLLRGSTWLGRAIQQEDIRQPLTYIFWTNILVLVLFLLFRGINL